MLYFEIIPVEILRLILSRSLPDNSPSYLAFIPEFRDAVLSIEFWKLAFDWMGFTKYIKRGLFNKDLMRILEGDPYVTKSYAARSPEDLFKIWLYEYESINISTIYVAEMLSHKKLVVKVLISEILTNYSILLDNLDISEDVSEIIYDDLNISPYVKVKDMSDEVDYSQFRTISVNLRTGVYANQPIRTTTLIMQKTWNTYETELYGWSYDITFKNGKESFYNLLIHVLYNRYRNISISYDDN